MPSEPGRLAEAQRGDAVQTGPAGKVVIVTATTANIGRGIALALAAEGARVVIVGRDITAMSMAPA